MIFILLDFPRVKCAYKGRKGCRESVKKSSKPEQNLNTIRRVMSVNIRRRSIVVK